MSIKLVIFICASILLQPAFAENLNGKGERLNQAHSSVKQILYKDWRLDKPFMYGFLTSLTFGVSSFSKHSFTESNGVHRSGVPSGMLTYIVHHNSFAYFFGLTIGMFLWAYIVGSFFYRLRNKEFSKLFHHALKTGREGDYVQTTPSKLN